jgi:hypothetical protein
MSEHERETEHLPVPQCGKNRHAGPHFWGRLSQPHSGQCHFSGLLEP